MLKMVTETLQVDLNIGPDMVDITHDLEQAIHKADIKNGTLSASINGSTGSLTTIEYEPGVVADLKRAINQIAPPGIEYEHEKAWHDGNGHSHVQAAIMGSSIQLPIRNGQLKIGTWQQVVAINHDNRSRRRTIDITLIGSN